MSDEAKTDDSKFDWVAKRSACSLPIVFSSLRQDVEKDVKARNALRPEGAPYEFSMEFKGNEFSVVLDAPDFKRSITFSLEDHAILVLDSGGNQIFEVTVNFNGEGKCVIKAKEESREEWQVRRMALEDLLFRTA